MAKERILVVEDESIVALDIKQRLEGLSYTVTGLAKAGEEAIAKARQTRPDLVLMDIKLKGEMDGVEAAEQIRTRLDIPVVFLTAYADDATLERTKAVGPYGYIIKPLEERELYTTIEMAIHKHRAEGVLKEREQLFRALIENAFDIIAVVDGDTTFRYLSPSVERVAGYKPEEQVGSKVLEMLHPDDVQRALTTFSQILQEQGTVGPVEFRLRHKDGSWRILETFGRNRLDNPAVQGVVVNCRDITERVGAEEALRVSEEKYRTLVENINDVIFTLDPQGTFTYISPSIERFSSYKTREILGQSFFRFVHPDDLVDLEASFQRTLDGQLEPREFRVCNKDGSLLHVRTSSRPIIEDGHLRGLLGVITDITEKKRAEEAVRESEIKYRTIFETNGTVTIIIEEDTTMSLVNSEFVRLTGYSKEEVEGKKRWTELVVPEDLTRMQEWHRLRRVDPASAPSNYQFRFLHKNGETRDALLSISLIPGTKQSLASILDITEHRRAEAALEQSEARYRAVVEQSGDGIALVDAQSWRLLEANPAFSQMLGYCPEEILGRSLLHFIAADPMDMERRFHDLLQRRTVSSFERQLRRQDGSLLDAWISANVISYAGRSIICILVRDLTEKKALEAQFLRSQRMDSLGMLAGGIAHDLNNILTPILINVELLKDGLPEGKSRQMLSSIAANAQRGADIVKHVLAFSRGMEGEQLMISLKYLLKEIEVFVKETFPKSIEIACCFPQGLWPLSGDATQIHQVLLNLCLNARDAMPRGGFLTLAAENVHLDEAYAQMHPEARPGPYLLLSITDTGTGIPPGVLDRIFDPFFTTKERGRGTGLGLSTVHGIVKSHGGFVRVYSEVGKGTRFHVFLPAVLSAEAANVEAELAPTPMGKGELILVVDDEASICEIAQATLDTHGYRVKTASNGAEAVAIYATHREDIQVVVTDMAMPVMDGLATIRALQTINPRVKVIPTSGLNVDGALAELNALSVKTFLQKPFTAQKLLRTLQGVLAS